MAPATFFYEKNEAFEELGAGENAIFESRTRFLVFAASVGYARDNRVDSPDENGEMRWSYISDNNKLAVIVAALTYADTGDPESILDPEAQIDTLTAYGAGGARIIQEEVVDKAGENLNNLVTFLQDYQETDDLPEPEILIEIENEISSVGPARDD